MNYYIPTLKTMVKTFCLVLSIAIALPNLGYANDSKTTLPSEEIAKPITGTVTDESGDPLVGVSVSVKGKSVGTITSSNGSFTLEAEEGDVLVFSYYGFTNSEVVISNQANLSVLMSQDINTLDEVVVIGYGTQKKSHLTGSISKVTNDKLDQIPIGRVDDALVGQVAGVNIQATNPAAGEAPAIRVRGQGSISFESNPLIVLDGIAVGTDADFLASLDMNDVESVEVLKDAASSAIYGSRGANGIIMITTKQGQEGPTRFSYDTYVGFKSVPDPGYLTSAASWLDYTRANNGGELTEKLQYVERFINASGETDWHKAIMDGGLIQSHAISARGGTKNTKFRASLSYLNDEGVLVTDNYEKINFRLNLDTKVSNRISFGVVLNPSYTDQRQFPIGFHDAIRQHAWNPLYLNESNIGFVNRFRENGRWADAQIGDYGFERMFDDYDLAADQPSTGSGTDISGTSNQSAYAKVLERNYNRKQTKIFANSYVNFNITDDLFFKQSVGGDFRYTKRNRWDGSLASRNGAAATRVRRDEDNQIHYVSESTLNFNKDFGSHELNFVGGMAFEKWEGDNTYLESGGYDNDLIQTIPAANIVGADQASYEEALISYLSRVNYAYAGKYFLSVSARWDGSSKFGPNNKFGFFPAVSAGWRVSEEAFLKDNNFIEELKLRASYGITGSNAGIGRYDHIGLITPVGTGIGLNGFNADNISNSDLAWEKLREMNLGLDLAVLNGRFGVGFDYYIRTSEDLLLELPVPSVTGFTSALVNRGEVENKGFELELRSRNISTKGFSWTTTALFTRNKNTLVDFAGSSGLISSVDSKRPAEWIALEGQPIASFYGYVVEREIPLEFIKDPFYPINAQSQDIYVKDLNGDGLIDPDDRTILGSPYPDLIWSLNNVFRIGDFDASIMLQGSHGAEIRNISSQYVKNEFSGNQDYTSDFPDKDLVVQRIFTNDDIQDASYVAIRNVNIGYTLPRSLLSKVGINKFRLYVGAQNLLYMMADGYQGYNPEGIDTGGSNTPLTYGYQRGPAPIFRTISVGANLGF